MPRSHQIITKTVVDHDPPKEKKKKQTSNQVCNRQQIILLCGHNSNSEIIKFTG